MKNRHTVPPGKKELLSNMISFQITYYSHHFSLFLLPNQMAQIMHFTLSGKSKLQTNPTIQAIGIAMIVSVWIIPVHLLSVCSI
jgi:hypothetical protein